jgi:hypothetical protein
MKQGSIQELESQIRAIRKSISSKPLQANQILSITKSTPENLLPYKFDDRRINTICEFFNLTSNAMKLILQLLSIGWHRKAKDKPIYGDDKSLFISHLFLHLPRSSNEIDPFFGNLPNDAKRRGLIPEIWYINQVSSSLKSDIAKSLDNVSRSKVLGIETLRAEYLLLYFENLQLAFKLFANGVKNKSKDSQLLLRVAVMQVSLQTFRNQIISTQVAKIVISGEIKELWLTFEGHAYERSILQAVLDTNSNVEINLYQHAPVLPEQTGVMDLLEDFGDRVNVYTSGSITYKYFIKQFPNLASRLHIGGSSKAFTLQDVMKSSEVKSRNYLLFLPEGTTESLLSMVNLAIDVSNLDNSIDLLIRSHPNSPKDALLESIELTKTTSIILSENTLISDFSKSFACIYRSSATVIESMPYGLLPIHFDPSGGRNLDCLALSSLKYPVIDSAFSLLEIFKSGKMGFENSVFSKQAAFENFSKEYFTPWEDRSR